MKNVNDVNIVNNISWFFGIDAGVKTLGCRPKSPIYGDVEFDDGSL
jgi:hypothetical protein